MAETMTWTGDERRTGHDRRRMTILPEAERRAGDERRRGGVGTSHPDPTAALLGGTKYEAIGSFGWDQVWCDERALACMHVSLLWLARWPSAFGL